MGTVDREIMNLIAGLPKLGDSGFAFWGATDCFWVTEIRNMIQTDGKFD